MVNKGKKKGPERLIRALALFLCFLLAEKPISRLATLPDGRSIPYDRRLLAGP